MPTVETNGVRTYYEERGEGQPIVLVHGLDGNHSDWAHQLDALSDEYRVIAYDIRGSGYTGSSDERSYSIELFADDLHVLVDKLGLDEPVVVGHSMGAKVAITYAARYPDDLSALIFASTSHPDTDTRLLPTLLFKGLYLPLQVSTIGLLGWEAKQAVDEWVNKRVFGSTDSEVDEESLSVDVPKEMTAREFWKRNTASFDGEPGDLEVSNVTAPTLVLYGENDAGLIVESAGDVTDEVSAPAEEGKLEDAGHDLPRHHPETFNQAVSDFLDRV